MVFEKSRLLKERAHRIIPGGCHTYAKGDDQYPEDSPGFIMEGSGCHVKDVDGNTFIEYGMGLRSVTLGHGYRPVLEAAMRQMEMGSNFLRPSPLEVECAEELAGMIQGAEMVKFAKNGSDATSAAVRLARAYTGRDMVGICREHAFFSVDDWFIGSTEMSAGIPKAVRELTVTFSYNDLGSVEDLFAKHPKKIACLILEPEKSEPPREGFLSSLARLCSENGAVLIFDEMITGFRWDNGGGQAYHHVIPDLSTFGKAMGNGFSIAALAGKRELMERGGLDHGEERVFLLSLTHGAENVNLAAALEVMKTYQREPVVEALWRQGRRLSDGINSAIHSLGLEGFFELVGRPCCLAYATRDENKHNSQPFRTLFLQELIRRGILAPSLVVSYAHTDKDIDSTINAIGESLKVYKNALENGVEKYLVGRPVKPVFRRFN
jgi:glutamate-1-semialdehyde 2,1-aminomutase